MKKINGRKIRSVDQYLALLKAAGRSDITIRNYRQVLKQYAAFLGVPIEQLHEHLDPDDLVRYAGEIAGKREAGRKSTMITIRRYFTINGVEMDELESNVTKVQVTEERDDKPLTAETLRGMMDQATPHGKALLTFLVSTGCRAGETSKILLSDVGRIVNETFVPDINGSVVRVRNEIAKRKHGGLVFLTGEAREYLTIWLKERDRFIERANEKASHLYTSNERHTHTPRKETGCKQVKRPENDQRLFAVSYGGIDKTFNRLYRAVDGERGVTGNKITAHSCRAYFRTNAARTMGIDLCEGILRHTGYLNAAYVRMPKSEQERMFHAGETVLYITRADHRIQTTQLKTLARENDELRKQMAEMRKQINDLSREVISRLEDSIGVADDN